MSATTLCLACSSSPSPRNSSDYRTPCCSRPICSNCVQSNPRLARYKPCLACIGGVGVIAAQSASSSTAQEDLNLDGRVKDEDVFVLGDEDEEDNVDVSPNYDNPWASDPDPPKPPRGVPASAGMGDTNRPVNKYVIQSGDTLSGISLKFGVDGRELCRLNKLPPSTLSTTPHLLHTRRVLVLPPHLKTQSGDLDLEGLSLDDQVRRQRERAAKRLQFVTKEVDWRVAKAYVALAEDEPTSKEMPRTLEESAIEQYMDDVAWEKSQPFTAKAGGPSEFRRRLKF